MIDALNAHGILLESDPRLPSVVSLVAGKPVWGSWWGHPSGGAVYRALNELADHADVTTAKLVSGKVTFVHRRLWPHLFAVGSARDPWQMAGLSAVGHALLALVDARSMVRTDDPSVARATGGKQPSAIAVDLERRILVHGSQVHTETGRHLKLLESWQHWATKARVRRTLSVHRAQSELDQLVNRLNARFHGSGRLPWWR